MDGRPAGGVASKGAGRAAGRAADGAAGGAAGGADGGAAGRADGGTAGGADSESAGRAAEGADGKSVGGAAGGAANGADSESAGGAAGGAKTIRVWTEITIILTNSLAYVPKLEKQNKQPGKSFFHSCSTNVIRNATFARRCLQVIGNLRFASPLFGQVCSAKLFKASSHARVCLAAVFGPLGGFSASNFWHLLESRRSEYSTVPAYIIPSFAVKS